MNLFKKGGRGHWAFYYTSPQSIFLIRLLKNFGDYYIILIGWFIKLSVRIFQPLIVICVSSIWDVHQFSGHCLIPLDP